MFKIFTKERENKNKVHNSWQSAIESARDYANNYLRSDNYIDGAIRYDDNNLYIFQNGTWIKTTANFSF